MIIFRLQTLLINKKKLFIIKQNMNSYQNIILNQDNDPLIKDVSNKNNPGFYSKLVAEVDEDERKNKSMREPLPIGISSNPQIKINHTSANIKYQSRMFAEPFNQKCQRDRVKRIQQGDQMTFRSNRTFNNSTGNDQFIAQLQKINVPLRKKTHSDMNQESQNPYRNNYLQNSLNQYQLQQKKLRKPIIIAKNVIKSILVSPPVQNNPNLTEINEQSQRSIPFWEKDDDDYHINHFIPASFEDKSYLPILQEKHINQNNSIMKNKQNLIQEVNQLHLLTKNKEIQKNFSQTPRDGVQRQYFQIQSPPIRQGLFSLFQGKQSHQPKPIIRACQRQQQKMSMQSFKMDIPNLQKYNNEQIKKQSQFAKKQPLRSEKDSLPMRKQDGNPRPKTEFNEKNNKLIAQFPPKITAKQQVKVEKMQKNNLQKKKIVNHLKNKQQVEVKINNRQVNRDCQKQESDFYKQAKQYKLKNSKEKNSFNSFENGRVKIQDQSSLMQQKLSKNNKYQKRHQQNVESKPRRQRIEDMNNLVPKDILNQIDQSDGKDQQRQDIPNKSTDPTHIIQELRQQLLRANRKLKLIQTKIAYKSIDRGDNINRKITILEDQNVRRKNFLSVNYKQYNKLSPGRQVYKKIIPNSQIQSSVQPSLSDQEFTQIQNLNNAFQNPPHPDDTCEQLSQLGMAAFKKFGVKLNYYSFMDLTRQRQKVCFKLNKQIVIIWEYTGRLYFGGTSIKRGTSILDKEGQGIQIWPNNYIYKGAFSRNKKNGYGIYINSKGDRYRGYWKNQYFDGRGKLSNECSQYDGQFKAGAKHGIGFEIFSNGDSYDGDYEDGKFHGRGKYIWRNRTFYEGDFKKGYMDGQGVWTSYKGDTYEGHYFKNMKHGFGIYRWNNGKVFQGNFENGHRVIKMNNNNKANITVQKEITYDNESHIDECQRNGIQNEGGESNKMTFAIRSFEEDPVERRNLRTAYFNKK